MRDLGAVMRAARRLLPLLLLLAAPARADEWQKTFPVTGTPDLSLDTRDGRVTVKGWDRPEIGVRVVTTRWHIGPGGVTVEARQDGNKVVVTVRQPHDWMGFSISFNPQKRLEIEVNVPRQSNLAITTGDGAVTLDDVSGRVMLHSGDGAIHASGVRGEFDIETGDGAIEISNVDGRVRAHSGDGHVRLEGRFDALDLGTGDGRVTAVAQPGSRVSDQGWSIQTGDGPVQLTLPRNLDAELDVRTHDGHISTELPVRVSGTYGRRELHGDLGRGGAPLRVRSGDGSVHIETGG
jgi:DUF4097 and DUF4098 domain-containing protein YvlB